MLRLIIELIILVGLVNLSCATKGKEKVVTDTKVVNNVADKYFKIKNAIEQENYTQSLDLAQSFLQELSVNDYTQRVLFFSARSNEGLGKWDLAIEGYRKVILDTTATKELRASSLYRISFCYEALGQDNKTIASLLDVLKRRDYIENEVYTAEVPARLAAAYARAGNKKMADKYFAQAEIGIKNLKTQANAKDLTTWLPKTLYFMGSMNLSSIDFNDVDSALKPLTRSQAYLLESALLGDAKWSPKSVEEIKSIYTNLIKNIQLVPTQSGQDQEVTERAKQELKWKIASNTLEAIRKLKVSVLASSDLKLKEANDLVVFIENQENALVSVLEESPSGSGLTKEAKSRQGLKRKGKVLNPDPALEEISVKGNK